MTSKVEQVGSQDPERRNSPVAGDMDEDRELPRQEASEEAACYFNDKVYRSGTYVRSGTALLKCSRGVWVEAGPGDPDNP